MPLAQELALGLVAGLLLRLRVPLLHWEAEGEREAVTLVVGLRLWLAQALWLLLRRPLPDTVEVGVPLAHTLALREGWGLALLLLLPPPAPPPPRPMLLEGVEDTLGQEVREGVEEPEKDRDTEPVGLERPLVVLEVLELALRLGVVVWEGDTLLLRLAPGLLLREALTVRLAVVRADREGVEEAVALRLTPGL